MTSILEEKLEDKYSDDKTLPYSERVFRCIMRAGAKGISLPELSSLLDLESKSCSHAASYAIKVGRIFVRGPYLRKMFFGEEAWADAWVQPPDHIKVIDKLRFSKRTVFRNQYSIKSKEQVEIEKLKLEKKGMLSLVKGEAFVPENVKVTIAPVYMDYRYQVSPDFKGDFIREWERKRS